VDVNVTPGVCSLYTAKDAKYFGIIASSSF
jgi:hypothetical protein